MNTDLEQSAKARFNCLGELGRGESTIVELIYDEERNTTLARKRWQRTNAELRFRLKQQFRRAQAISHPNLVRVYDLLVDSNETSLTMEAVSGSEVVTHIHALALSGCDDAHFIATTLDVLRQLTAALITLHGAGVVHRDVKPRNVLIEAGGRVVLLDAGFAWPPEQHFDPQRDRVLAATLPYLAPECLRGALPSEESDWYSFGALAAELISGRPPFSGPLEAMLSAKDAAFASLRDSCACVPEVLDELVCGLLVREPKARPTAIEVQELLEQLCAEYPAPVPLAAETASPDAEIAAAFDAVVANDVREPLLAEPEVRESAVIFARSREDESRVVRTVAGAQAASADASLAEITAEQVAIASGELADPGAMEASSVDRAGPDTDVAVERWISNAQLEASALPEAPLELEASVHGIEVSAEPTPPQALAPSDAHAQQSTRDAAVDEDAGGSGADVSALDVREDAGGSGADVSALDVREDAGGSGADVSALDVREDAGGSGADVSALDVREDAGGTGPDALALELDGREDLQPQAANEPWVQLALEHYGSALLPSVAPTPVARDHQSSSQPPWIQLALEHSVPVARVDMTTAREPWIEQALERYRSNSQLPLPAVSEPPIAIDADAHNTGDAQPSLALSSAAESPDIDATLLELSDTVVQMHAADDASQRLALEPHELPEPTRDPEYPALPLIAADADALELAYSRSLDSRPELAPPLLDARPAVSFVREPATVRAKTVAAVELAAATEPAGASITPPSASAPAAGGGGASQPSVTRLEQLLKGGTGAQLLLIRGDAGSGKSELLRALLERAEAWPQRTVLASGACSRPDTAFEPVRGLIRELLLRQPRDRFLPQGCVLDARRAAPLLCIFPELQPLIVQAVNTNGAPAVERQRRWIDAMIGFRALFRQLSAERALVIAIDDVHALDLDSARLLRALLGALPLPRVTWLLTQRVACDLPEPLAALLDPGQPDARLPIVLHDMDPLRASRPALAAIRRDATAPTNAAPESMPAGAELDATALLRAAEAAGAQLALQLSADLHARALARASAAKPSQLEAAATAYACAGRLRDASETWLSLARITTEPKHAQHFELAAGAALLRAGDEERGRALLHSVLHDCGLSLPRAPLLTSTLERARLLFQSHKQRVPVHDAGLRRRRFDALWSSAKELVLISPVTGDALSVRALREALLLGDASRLAWALGYEAASEANIGGTYMRRRATTLVREMCALAQQSGSAFDDAYARSVEAVVAWFAGDWYEAEHSLRAALVAYASAPVPSAHEQHVVGTFLVGALEAQGKLEALRELLPDLQLMAAETGHQLAGALYVLAEASLPALASDRPVQAIARADAVLAEFGSDGFTPLHFQHFVATISARLYAGHNAQAFQQVEQTWLRVRHTYLPQLEAVSVMLLQLRARATLALAKQSSAQDAARLTKLAAKLAHALGNSSLPHALALRHVIEANLAILRGRPASADSHCRLASQGFEATGMTLMSEVARYARAALAETSEAQQDAARCRAFFARAGVLRPAAFVQAWFPALGS